MEKNLLDRLKKSKSSLQLNRFFILLFVLIWSSVLAEENFLLLNDTTDEMCKAFGDHLDQRVSPCSTFKIPLSLMGFDAGILEDEDHPKWPYQEGYVDYIEAWKSAQTPRSWMKFSCVWYSQVLAAQLNLETIQDYLGELHYGNQDMSGDLGKNNGLTRAWLSSSLKISPREQLYFLQKLVREELPFSDHAIRMTKQLLFIEELPQGWKLFGKTGLCGGADRGTPEFGWFVGWVEKEGRIYIFVYNIQSENVDSSKRIPRVKQLLAGVLCSA